MAVAFGDVPSAAAGPSDVVGRVPAGLVVSPGSTAEVAEAMHACARQDLAVVVRGAGTKLDWGADPERLDVVVDTSRLAGVVEHVAGDLVVTVRAGTPLSALASALAEAGQRLSVDPVVGPGATGPGTVGGLIATAATGPLRLSAGAVRDLLIGATVVRADGEVAHTGGKVVKNVAGYDLCKLLTGSWGTLAVVTEATFRLHPAPPASTWVLGPADPAFVASLLSSQLAPSAVELDGGSVAVLLEGSPAGVAARAAGVASLAGPSAQVSDGAPEWWGQPPWPVGGTGVRATFALSGLATLLAAVQATGLPWAVRGSAAVGVFHVGLPGSVPALDVVAAVEQLRSQCGAWCGQVVVLDAPADVRSRVDMWGPAGGLELMRRVKTTFDPERILSPGRFVGGI